MTRAIPESVGMSAARLERIGPAMQAYVDRGVYAGVKTIIARRGVVVHDGQCGWRDREAGAPMTEDTIFRLYSMTKPMVSTALMMLLEEGRIRLIDPVARFIPSFAGVKVLEADGSLVDPQRPMTIRDILTHTSGLSYAFLDDSPVRKLYADAKLHLAKFTLAEAIDDLARCPLAFHPGARWHYSLGIDVAARVIEVVSGQSLASFLAERLIEPLGMVDTAFHVPEGKRDLLATLYGRPDPVSADNTYLKAFELWRNGYNERIDVAATYPVDQPETFQRGGHGLFGTARDYLSFAAMLANGGELDGVRYLSRKTLALMHSNHVPPSLLPLSLVGAPLPGLGFGLGSRVMLDVAATGAPGSVGEFGWGGAATTYYWVDPTEQMIGIFMTQSLVGFDMPELDLRALAYGAIID
ncbi:MAG: serine hydrolase domain-containing protein [Roseiarcus sp.]